MLRRVCFYVLNMYKIKKCHRFTSVTHLCLISNLYDSTHKISNYFLFDKEWLPHSMLKTKSVLNNSVVLTEHYY